MPSLLTLDSITGYPYLIKRASPEVRVYSPDFRKLLTAISGIPVVTSTSQGLTANGTPLVVGAITINGTVVNIPLSVGTDREDYLIKIEVTTTGVEKIVEYVIIRMRG